MINSPRTHSLDPPPLAPASQPTLPKPLCPHVKFIALAAQDCSTLHRPSTNCAPLTPKSHWSRRFPRSRPKTSTRPTSWQTESLRRNTPLQEIFHLHTPLPPLPLPQAAPLLLQPTHPPHKPIHLAAQQPLPSLGSACLEPPLAPSQAQHSLGVSLPAFAMGLAPLALKFLNLHLTGCSVQESLLQCLPGLLAFLTSFMQWMLFSLPISYSGIPGPCTGNFQSLKPRCLPIHLVVGVCETWLTDVFFLSFPNYSYRVDRGPGGAGGGLLLLVHQSLSSSLLTITPFSGADWITRGWLLLLTQGYFRSFWFTCLDISLQEFQHLFSQFSSPALIIDNFNLSPTRLQGTSPPQEPKKPFGFVPLCLSGRWCNFHSWHHRVSLPGLIQFQGTRPPWTFAWRMAPSSSPL